MTDDTRTPAQAEPLPPDPGGGARLGTEVTATAAQSRFAHGNEGYAVLVWRRFKRSVMGMLGLVLVVLLIVVAIFADFFAPMDPKRPEIPFSPPDLISFFDPDGNLSLVPYVYPVGDTGEFDLVINNDSGLSNTPAEHYTYLFQLPIEERQSARNNMGRYENEQAWDLTEELWRVSVGGPGFQELMSQLQEISLVEMPAIPLWYNGLWSQVNNSNWTNWPSDDPETSDYYPSTWGGIGELKAYLLFTEIQPAG